MIRFRYVELKNFLSYGNKPTRWEFGDGELVRLGGPNGSGKSTVIEALFFALYGRSFSGKLKPGLVNSVNNGDCLVEVGLEKNGTQFVIRRGIKPNVLDVLKDGTAVPRPAKNADLDAYIAESVLEMSGATFANTQVMADNDDGKSSFFMQMSLGERRAIVDEILNLKQLTEIDEVLKEMASEAKAKAKELEIRHASAGALIASERAALESATKARKQQEERIKASLAQIGFREEQTRVWAKQNSDWLEANPELPPIKTGDIAELRKKREDLREFEIGCHGMITEAKTAREQWEKRKTDAADRQKKADQMRKLAEARVLEVESRLTESKSELDGVPSLEEMDAVKARLIQRIEGLREQIMSLKSAAKLRERTEDLIAKGMCGECARPYTAAEAPTGATAMELTKQATDAEMQLAELLKKANDVELNIRWRSAKEAEASGLESRLAGAKEQIPPMPDPDLDSELEAKGMESLDVAADEAKRNLPRILTMLADTEEALRQADNWSTVRAARSAERESHHRALSENLESLKHLGAQRDELEAEPPIPVDPTRLAAAEAAVAAIDDERGQNDDAVLHIKALRQVVGDDGLKSHIVALYLPFLNERVNHYLALLNFNVGIRFSPTFEFTVLSRGREDFTYKSFSNGQKARINCATLLSFNDLARVKATVHSNLLFLDEILDAHLDDSGVDDVLKVLKRKARDETLSVNVITHKMLVTEGFDRHRTAALVGGFTVLGDAQ
jgi:DNA repair exonuclease SbcCD ATPase subunit